MESNDTNTPNFKDKVLICQDCEKPFIFEAGEQKFYWVKELAPPKRCIKCRFARKMNAQGGK
jgi:hypothetical protein